MREFRFGFTVGAVRSTGELADLCAAAEGYGYDVVGWIDHIFPGCVPPLMGLLGAAQVSSRLQLSTYTLNVGWWNPAMLAREVVSAVRLTGGRLELGLGGGIIKEEFDDAGLPFLPFQERIDKIAEVLDACEARAAADGDEGYVPPPVLIGGNSKPALRLAAKRADIASFAGRVQIPGKKPGTLRIATADDAAQRAAYLRDAAGSRADDIELNSFVLELQVTGNRRAAMEKLAAESDEYLMIPDIDAALETPFFLYGTEEEIVAQVLANRERYGFSYITVQRPYMHAFGPLIKAIRAAQ